MTEALFHGIEATDSESPTRDPDRAVGIPQEVVNQEPLPGLGWGQVGHLADGFRFGVEIKQAGAKGADPVSTLQVLYDRADRE